MASHLERQLVTRDEGINTKPSTKKFSNGSSVARDGDWYYDIEMGRDCSSSACVVSEPDYDLDGNPITIEAQVQAQARCWNTTAQIEPPRVASRKANDTSDGGSISVECPSISSTSMRIVSVGKRIEDDTIGRAVDDTNKLVRLKNAHKLYSFTVGDLSWQTQDLAKVYGAECVGIDTTLCHGLRYNLSSSASSDGGLGRHLLIGSRYIPMHLIQATVSWSGTSTAPLVSFVKSQFCNNCDSVPSSVDLVLPHRFTHAMAFVNTSERSWKSTCAGRAEDFIFSKETNHLYIEQSLQPAYAAALFFLFQDSVVRDVLNISTTSSSGKVAQGTSGTRLAESLAFLRNTHLIDVTLSNPLPTVVLTLFGCAILLFISVGVGVFGEQREAKLQRMATVHTFAEMLINDKKFLSLLVKTALTAGGDDKQVVKQQKSDKVDAKATSSVVSFDGFRVNHITMVHPDGRVVELDPESCETTRYLAAV